MDPIALPQKTKLVTPMKTPKDQNPTAPAAMNRRQFAKVMASGVLTAGLAGSASVAAAASAGYTFRSDSRWFKNTKVRVTINNVFDRKPQMPFGYSAGTQQSLLAGRALSVETSKQF